MKAYSKNSVLLLTSYAFKNKHELSVFSSLVVIFLLLFSCVYNPVINFGLFIVLVTVYIIAIFLISPRKIRMDDLFLQYHIYWREKWDNIETIDFRPYDKTLLVKTRNSKTRLISNVDTIVSERLQNRLTEVKATN